MNEQAGRLPLQFPHLGSSRMFGDDRLARLAAGGDQRAFAAIYRRHHQELYRYCRALLRDPDEAQDALQATMVKAIRSLPGDTREIALKPWLFRVAHNEAINLIRSRTPSSELDPEQVAFEAGPEQQAATRERLRELVRDLDQLSERQRSTLVMRELNGLSFDEIGAAFELSAAAAKQSVYEARVSLQEMAEGREMECDRVREAISAEDRRVLRSRRMRAHLRECDGCRSFAAAIGRRRGDLAALAPPLALPAALATLHAVLGGGAGSTSAAAAGGAAATAGGVGFGGIGAGLGGSVAVKSAIAVLATAAIAGGAAGVTGVIDLNGSSSEANNSAQSSQPTVAPGSNANHQASSGAGADRAPATRLGSPEARGADRDRGGQGRRHANGNGHAAGGKPAGSADSAAAASESTPASSGQSATAPGQTQTSIGHSATAPGNSGTAPGQSNSSSGGSSASATGQAHSSAAGSQGGGAATAPGQSASAPGQAGTTPGQSGGAGNSESAPGHVK